MMRNITFISKYYHMGFNTVMELPYAVFLSYLKWARIFEMEKTPEGRDMLYKESTIYQTEPDLNRLRNLDGYKAKRE